MTRDLATQITETGACGAPITLGETAAAGEGAHSSVLGHPRQHQPSKGVSSLEDSPPAASDGAQRGLFSGVKIQHGPFAGLPWGSYDLIMADCPWRFELYSALGEAKSAQAHYECMSLDEIKALDVQQLAARDCLLFLWATNPMLDQAFEVLRAWRFKFKTAGSWEKITVRGNQAFGPGYILRTSNEPYLIGTIGSPETTNSVRSSFRGVAREHSRKPEEGFAHAEKLMPNARRIELFSRQSRPGWDNWGDQSNHFEDAHA